MKKSATKSSEQEKSRLSEEEKRQLELGKKLQAMIEMGYVNKRMAITMSFAKGVASGFGALIGATVLVALILWFLSFFDQMPFLGPISDAVEAALQAQPPSTTK